MPTSSIPTLNDVRQAMDQQRWWLALHRCNQLRAHFRRHVPREVYALGSTCLHRLGQFEEAEQWADEGLGVRKHLFSVGPVFSEAELLERWGSQSEPVVSIMCMTYNHERYVEKTIRGFLSQNSPYPFEIIIHDDASTDRTQDVIRRWHAAYPTIIRPILQERNILSKGGSPYNLMLAAARGRYIATCEGDDWWRDATKLEWQVGFLEANPDFVCTAHNYYHYVESQLTVKPWYPVTAPTVVTQRDLMANNRLLWVPTVVYRRVIDTLPPESFATNNGDMLLTSYLGTFGKCMFFEDRVSAVRRENQYSVWSPLPEAQKQRERVKTWMMLVRMHLRLGNAQAVEDVLAHVAAAEVPEDEKSALVREMLYCMPEDMKAA